MYRFVCTIEEMNYCDNNSCDAHIAVISVVNKIRMIVSRSIKDKSSWLDEYFESTVIELNEHYIKFSSTE